MRDLPIEIPGIDEKPIVTGLEFEKSGIKIQGKFKLNEFALLPAENLEFLRLYIKTRGNLKEVERFLEVSYPTVRSKFENMLRALGYENTPSADEAKDLILNAFE